MPCTKYDKTVRSARLSHATNKIRAVDLAYVILMNLCEDSYDVQDLFIADPDPGTPYQSAFFFKFTTLEDTERFCKAWDGYEGVGDSYLAWNDLGLKVVPSTRGERHEGYLWHLTVEGKQYGRRGPRDSHSRSRW